MQYIVQFERLANKQNHNSRVLLQNLSARLARSESSYEISFCETRKKRFSLRNFVARLASRDSHNKISVWETRKKQVDLPILARESRKNLMRILGLKSESWFSREFQKVILVSTLSMRKAKSPNRTIMWTLSIGLIRNGVFNFSRNTIIASC